MIECEEISLAINKTVATIIVAGAVADDESLKTKTVFAFTGQTGIVSLYITIPAVG